MIGTIGAVVVAYLLLAVVSWVARRLFGED